MKPIHLFVSSALFLSFSAHAALNMRPGLWKVDMTLKTGGKTINPAKEMQKAMASMPEAQRKEMMKTMGASSGQQVCYTKEMIQNPEALNNSTPKKCETKLKSNSENNVISSFKCQDGTKGEASWSLKNKETLTGKVDLTDPKGQKSQMNYNGTFLKSDCGDTKPVL